MKTNNRTIRARRIQPAGILRAALLIAALAALLAVPCLAAGGNEYAQAGANWVLDGVFWVGIVLVVWGVVKYAAARNITGVVTLVVLGAIVLVIIKQPTLLQTLGEKLMGIIGLSS